MSSYDYHMDGDKAEVGGTHAMQRATRTLIVCFDKGAVNFQVCLFFSFLFSSVSFFLFKCVLCAFSSVS
jgi:hypothetical protein